MGRGTKRLCSFVTVGRPTHTFHLQSEDVGVIHALNFYVLIMELDLFQRLNKIYIKKRCKCRTRDLFIIIWTLECWSSIQDHQTLRSYISL